MDGDECYCATADLDLTKSVAKKCSDECEGNAGEKCGDGKDASVYDGK